MDISKLLEHQKLLDEEIKKAHLTNNENVWSKRILALYVELSELANEIQSFKYWKKNKIKDQKKIIEEYSDGLHFLFSFALDLNLNPNIESILFSEDIDIQFIEIYNQINIFFKSQKANDLKRIIELYFGLGLLIGINENDLIEGYINKNKINFLRIKNNY
ncbi:MAG: dUTP diphosphatase [Metamycoplasmataceae bacterium]